MSEHFIKIYQEEAQIAIYSHLASMRSDIQTLVYNAKVDGVILGWVLLQQADVEPQANRD